MKWKEEEKMIEEKQEFEMGYVCRQGYSHVVKEGVTNVFCIGCRKIIYSDKVSEDISQQIEIVKLEQEHICDMRSFALELAQRIRENYVKINIPIVE